MTVMPAPSHRLELLTAPTPAGGTRVAFLLEGGSAAVRSVQFARALQPGQSALTFDALPEFHALASLAPQSAVVRHTRYVRTGPETFSTAIEEWRVSRYTRVIRDSVGMYAVTCAPLEDDLNDSHVLRELGSGGLSTWGFSATEETPTEILTRLKDALVAAGYTWIDVGTVLPTTPVSIALPGATTPRAVIDALVEACKAKGDHVEFQFTLAGDLSEYRLELVALRGGSLSTLALTTGLDVLELQNDVDSLDQATRVLPLGPEGVDLRELQLRIAAIDGGTGWLDLEALDGTAPILVAVDGQFNSKRLFRELTGRSFAITGSSATPPRVRVAVADLGSGLAAGERISFRDAEDNAGTRRFVATRKGEVPVRVVSTLTAPNRIRTNQLLETADWLFANNQLRDWTAERSQFIEELDSATIDEAAGEIVLDLAPTNPPQAGDWILFVANPFGGTPEAYGSPVTVESYDGGSLTIGFSRRYAGEQVAYSGVVVPGMRLYRPVGTPMWIKATLVANNELEVDALPGPAFANTDVLEIWQRCQGTRLVELVDQSAEAVYRRKCATVEVATATGMTNLAPNPALEAWAGGPTDPPDGWTVENSVGSVTLTRDTDPLTTRYGGKSWKADFAVGASADLVGPLVPIHPVHGADVVAAAVALLFTRFTDRITFDVTLYAEGLSGVRTPLGVPLRIHPANTTVDVDASLKAKLEQWYDGILADRSIRDLREEQLRLVLSRPAGASNPACTLHFDAWMLVQRPGFVQAAEGGARWILTDEVIPMLAAGHEILRERSRPLARYSARVLRQPEEFVLGRQAALTVVPFATTHTLRLAAVRERLELQGEDDERRIVGVLEADFERYRPNVARLLAAPLTLVPPPVPLPAPALELPTLEVSLTRDDTNGVIAWAGSPIVMLSIDGGVPALAPASPITVPRPPANTPAKRYRFVATNGDTQFDKPETVDIPPKDYAPAGEPVISTLAVTVTDAPGDGGGEFEVDITVANMPIGTTYAIAAEVISGDPISSGTYADSGLGIGDFPQTGLTGCAMAPGARLKVEVAAINGGDVIATKQVTVTA